MTFPSTRLSHIESRKQSSNRRVRKRKEFRAIFYFQSVRRQNFIQNEPFKTLVYETDDFDVMCDGIFLYATVSLLLIM